MRDTTRSVDVCDDARAPRRASVRKAGVRKEWKRWLGNRVAVRTCARAAFLTLLLAAASPTLAAGDEMTRHVPNDWLGRYCTTQTCAESKPGPLDHAAGFGLAVLGTLWLSGRRSAKT